MRGADHLLPPAIRNFLESVKFAAGGFVQAAKSSAPYKRCAIRSAQTLDPPVWLAVRNAILLNRPVKLSFDGNPVLLMRKEPLLAISGPVYAANS